MHNIIMSAYDSVLNQDGWYKTLDEIVAAFGARAASLVVQEQGNLTYGVHFLSDVYRNMIERTGDYYLANLAHHEEPDFKILSTGQPGKVMFDTEFGLTLEERDARPDYRFLAENAGVGRRFGFRLNNNRGFFDAVAIGYDRSVPKIPRAYSTQVQLISQHLAKAMEVSRAFIALKNKFASVIAALDQFGFGIAITTSYGEVVVSTGLPMRYSTMVRPYGLHLIVDR